VSDLQGDIWKFINNPINVGGKDSTGDSAPPILVGAGYSSSSPNSPGSVQTLGIGTKFPVDVINTFHWTHTPLTKRQEVPYIYLSEKRLKTNALIAQAAYNLMTISPYDKTGLLSRVGRTAESLSQPILGDFTQKISNLFQSGLQNLDKLGSIGGLKENIGQFFNLGDVFSLPRGGSGARNVLKVYEGLYITEPTGWEYIMPYFEDRQNGVANQFSNENTQQIGQGFGMGAEDLVTGIRDVAQAGAGLVNIFQPGTYIEKPKFYDFQDSGDELTIEFPLLNTGHATYRDVTRNWQFIYLLIYQNRPVRFTRDLIEPPAIYEVSLPGVKYMPYAYISNLEVQFMGSRRPMNIRFKDESSQGQTQESVNTIIHDGYSIQITLKGLVAETKNFMYTSLNADPVTVTTIGR
jgi:hypothetical protein